jgi:hypothetical protein
LLLLLLVLLLSNNYILLDMMLSGRSWLSMLAVRKRQLLGTVSFVESSSKTGGNHSDNGRHPFSSYKSPPSGEDNSNNSNKEENQKRCKDGGGEIDRISISDSRRKKQLQQEQQRGLDDPPQVVPVQRFKNSKRKEWNHQHNNSKSSQKQSSSSVLQTTDYSWKRRHYHRHNQNPRPFQRTTVSQSTVPTTDMRHVPSIVLLKSIDSSALLNPRQFCASKSTTTLPHHHTNVSRTINGTDAARRLLRGKKECLLAARKMINSSPLMLTGHNVPAVLIQHFVNMGDQLLKHYGPDAVECSFHNYHQERRTSSVTTSRHPSNHGSDSSTVTLPLHVRVRQRDATNACLPPPAAYDTRIYDNCHVDWDHHLELYLTVMQNFANPFGKIFDLHHHNNNNHNTHPTTKDSTTKSPPSSAPPAIDKYDFEKDDDDYDFTASPLLFDLLPPRWNVDILKGEYYDLQKYVPKTHNNMVVDPANDANINVDVDSNMVVATVTDRRQGREQQRTPHDSTTAGTTTNAPNDQPIDLFQPIPPFPIVEFLQESSKGSGHVLIRIQGIPTASHYFGTDPPKQQQPQPITLVFDAGYYKNPSMSFREH